MAMSLEHLQDAQRNPCRHVGGLHNGWDEMVEFGRQEHCRRCDFVQSIANVVANEAASVVGPVTPLAASVAVTRQYNVVSAGRSAGGVNDVREEPSLTVAVTSTGLNAALDSISNL